MKHRTWITAALTAGGTLAVGQLMRGKTILRAEMSWPGESTLYSDPSLGLEDALDSLERKLSDDAADQHLKNSGL